MKKLEIEEDCHYGSERMFIPIFNATKRIESRNYIFDKSCLYKIDEKSCVNKLFGWSFGLHHINSVRVGWSCEDDEIILWGYIYEKGKLNKKRICDVPVDKEINVTIYNTYKKNKKNQNCKIIVDMLDGKHVYYIVYEFADSKTCIGYTLGLYFGGNSTAPHDMIVYMEKK